MSDIFISYKREDEARVIRLVRALERAGLSVWWDRSLAAGDNWRAQIESELSGARCVIAVWTRASTGPDGDFVRDEAGHAKTRGRLVPVMLDKVAAPLGFGEIQAVDLTHWKGSPRDPFFKDLSAAVTAKLEDRPVPPAKGPANRLMRRLTYSGLTGAILFLLASFGFNLFGAQDHVCAVPLFQPGLSDLCGSFGLGHRPSRPERIAWEARKPGNCADLRTHIERFPNGAYRDQAAGMLAARRITQTEVWTPSTRRLALFEPQDEAASINQAAAQAAALARSQPNAELRCRGFAAATLFRFKSAKPLPQLWNCKPAANGVACGFEGEAVCELEESRINEQETCGS